MQSMRTTIDLPDDLHEIATRIARDQGSTLSSAVAQLMRRAMQPSGSANVEVSDVTGLRVLRLGRPITTDDVRSLEDD